MQIIVGSISVLHTSCVCGMHVCGCTCICVHVCVEDRGRPQDIFFNNFPLCLRKNLTEYGTTHFRQNSRQTDQVASKPQGSVLSLQFSNYRLFIWIELRSTHLHSKRHPEPSPQHPLFGSQRFRKEGNVKTRKKTYQEHKKSIRSDKIVPILSIFLMHIVSGVGVCICIQVPTEARRSSWSPWSWSYM